MQANQTQAPTPRPNVPASVPVHQLDLALDHPRLKGLSPSERRDAIVIIAQLMLKAGGMRHAATTESRDEHA